MSELEAMEPNDYLMQIAQLLVDSSEVPTDMQDVADAAAVVQMVKRTLDWLTKARDANVAQCATIDSLSAKLEECRRLNAAGQAEIERLNNQIQRWNTGANELQDKYLAAQQEIGALTAKLETATRNAKRMADEAANLEARYEGLSEAFGMALDKLAGVGK